MDVTLSEGDFLALTEAGMQAPGASSETTLEVTGVLVLTPATCQQRECSKVVINCKLLGDLVPKDGGDVLVRISTGTERVQLSVPFEPDNTPELQNLDPKTMDVSQISTQVLKIYGSNMKPEFCSESAGCSVSFDFSKFALVDRVRAGGLGSGGTPAPASRDARVPTRAGSRCGPGRLVARPASDARPPGDPRRPGAAFR